MEGYAVICPVYFSTYNREKTLKTWWANESDLYKNTIIKIGKDFRRSIDFIESRNEFDINYLSYNRRYILNPIFRSFFLINMTCAL